MLYVIEIFIQYPYIYIILLRIVKILKFFLKVNQINIAKM